MNATPPAWPPLCGLFWTGHKKIYEPGCKVELKFLRLNISALCDKITSLKSLPYRMKFLLVALTAFTSSSFAQKINSKASYKEPHRPQIHFSPKTGWMNDPNGMIYHNGVYHLFFQYYPDSTVWGPMHWGHATSKDLFHWREN